MAGALAVAIIAAFLAGRVTQPPPQTIETAGKESGRVRERIVLVAVGDHLEKSQMMLIELANADPQQGSFDLSAEQERARDLLSSNRLYKQSAQKVGDPALRKVLDDLERVLVEVANSGGELDSTRLEEIQQQIASQGLLFRVRVVGSKVNSKVKEEAQTAPETGKAAQRKL
jgi:multidrug efflux pump subunit AcrA (membrane-fusion protein)